MAESKLAIVVGSEGDGLAHETIAEADYVGIFSKCSSF